MATRQSLPRAKANTRPAEKAGLLPTKRRTSEQVRADNEEKERRKAADLAAKAAAKNAKVSRIAELEEQMAVNDADEQLVRHTAPPPEPPRSRPRPRLRTGPQLTRTFAVSDLNGAYEDGRQPECTGVVVTNVHKVLAPSGASVTAGDGGYISGSEADNASIEEAVIRSPPKKKQKSAIREAVSANKGLGAAVTKGVTRDKPAQNSSVFIKTWASDVFTQAIRTPFNSRAGTARSSSAPSFTSSSAILASIPVYDSENDSGSNYNGFGNDEDEIIERIAALASPSKAGGIVGLVQPKAEEAEAQPAVRKSRPTTGIRVEPISELDEVQTVPLSTKTTTTRTTANTKARTAKATTTVATNTVATSTNVVATSTNATNAQLPAGVFGRWRSQFVPTYMIFVGGQRDPWNIDDPTAESAIKEAFTVVYPNVPYPQDSVAQQGMFGVLNQRIYEYRGGFGSTALMALHDYLGALPQLNCTDLQQAHLKQMLEKKAFLYEKFDMEMDRVTPYWGGLLRSPFIIQTFAHHFTFTEGAKNVPGFAELTPKGALALSAAAMERAFTLWAEGMIGFNKRGVPIVLPARNARTGKESKIQNAFAEQNWGDAIRLYARSVENLKSGSFAKIVEQAKAFANQTRLASKRHVPMVINCDLDDEMDDRGCLQDLSSDEDA
ncbi:hypothetical protein EW026_g5311 [Hermanssonia centrifuga]|uniref:DUF6532 domain-containing protein n=1 Tax=Hermanssonia centrifuga TaxID=98765 RepID=A0A4S4KEH2_9APHY|nr:hypothetical protein EW026_g5311 [Hermanssonia centrifuga]